jgi:SnoaL-like domain
MSVRDVADSVLEAFAHSDLAAAERLCAEDVVVFGTDTDEVWHDRDALLRALGGMRELDALARRSDEGSGLGRGGGRVHTRRRLDPASAGIDGLLRRPAHPCALLDRRQLSYHQRSRALVRTSNPFAVTRPLCSNIAPPIEG